MTTTRRTFLRNAAAGLAGAGLVGQLAVTAGRAAEAKAKIRVSARHFGSNLAAAKKAGLDGVEVGVGGPADKLFIADPEFRKKIKAQMKATGLAVSSLSMDLLNRNPVATDPRGEAWLLQTIEAAADLGAAGILVPFFGGASALVRGKKLLKDRVDALAARMKKVAPLAEKAGVALGLENTCSAKQNLQILDQIGSKAVACYYDIGNSTYRGYDAPAEIRELKGRICLIHFKDGGHYLGEGKVKMNGVAEALKAIDYQGWVVLETACPSKNREADCKRNAEYVRKLMA
jgi:L-ribulose-5-phosphate 3-epimerase